MANKQILTENTLDKIIAGIFKAIGKGRSTPTMKQLMKDPEYRRIHQNLERAREDLRQWADEYNKKYPMETPAIDKALGIKR